MAGKYDTQEIKEVHENVLESDVEKQIPKLQRSFMDQRTTELDLTGYGTV